MISQAAGGGSWIRATVYAMQCGVLSKCTGAILGKALEPSEKGTGVIMVQVTLR